MAKHVTFFKMKVQPGKAGDLTTMMSGQQDEERIKNSGWQMSIVGASKDDPNTVWGAVTWDNSENYYKNAESPAQNESYQKMRALLAGDPEWFDCDVLEESSA
jgi:hypothetical protein